MNVRTSILARFSVSFSFFLLSISDIISFDVDSYTISATPESGRVEFRRKREFRSTGAGAGSKRLSKRLPEEPVVHREAVDFGASLRPF
jgi:hypothetical protein